MSYVQAAKVWELDLRHDERDVLSALAWEANNQGEHCYPSVACIAYESGWSERQVQRILKRFLQAGLIEITMAATASRPTEYRLCLGLGAQRRPWSEVREERKAARLSRGASQSPHDSEAPVSAGQGCQDEQRGVTERGDGVSAATRGVTEASKRGAQMQAPDPGILDPGRSDPGNLDPGILEPGRAGARATLPAEPKEKSTIATEWRQRTHRPISVDQAREGADLLEQSRVAGRERSFWSFMDEAAEKRWGWGGFAGAIRDRVLSAKGPPGRGSPAAPVSIDDWEAELRRDRPGCFADSPAPADSTLAGVPG